MQILNECNLVMINNIEFINRRNGDTTNFSLHNYMYMHNTANFDQDNKWRFRIDISIETDIKKDTYPRKVHW